MGSILFSIEKILRVCNDQIDSDALPLGVLYLKIKLYLTLTKKMKKIVLTLTIKTIERGIDVKTKK